MRYYSAMLLALTPPDDISRHVEKDNRFSFFVFSLVGTVHPVDDMRSNVPKCCLIVLCAVELFNMCAVSFAFFGEYCIEITG